MCRYNRFIDGRGRCPPLIPTAFLPMNTILCLVAALLAVVIGTLIWFSETPADRARRWGRAGISQRQIADRLGVTRYRVRTWLAT